MLAYIHCSGSNFSADVSEDAQRGRTIIQVAATDDDDSYANKKLDYSIVKGNTEKGFQISSSTGEIILTGSLDREKTAIYNLVVMAKDRGEPSLNSTSVVQVRIDDINDNPPVFNQSTYNIVVNESIAVGTMVIQVVATDMDADENGRVKYNITSGNDDNRFVIDESTGWIRVRADLDHETRAEHRLVIRAIDQAVKFPQRSTFTTVIINVTDVNEFSPRFPVMMYLESVPENKPVDSTVFTAHAVDSDGGKYGVVEYSLIGDQDLFQIDRQTGHVTTKAVFDYESMNSYHFKVMAKDLGKLFATVPVLVNIESQDEFSPRFNEAQYSFGVSGNAKVGTSVGQVEATDRDGGSSGQIVYSLKYDNDYFGINATTGVVVVIKDLQSKEEQENRRKRWVPRYRAPHRSKRALEGDNIKLTVVAGTGLQGSRTSEVSASIRVDRSCSGCGAPIAGASTGALSGVPLVLVIVFAIIAIVAVIVIVIMYIRNREQKRRPPDHSRFDESFASMDVHVHTSPANRDEAPPSYNQILSYHSHNGNVANITTSEISDQSHSASSGRGSAEDEEEDEEIRMINSTPLGKKRENTIPTRGAMPDSGIQQDEDTISELSVQNHQEYLARLGIDTSRIKVVEAKPTGLTQSVESMHQFSEEGGGEGDGMDIGHLVYDKLGEVEADEDMAIMDGTREFGFGETDPSHAGSLSSVINSEEEFSGSYNWDYLLDWGPQYQPLAHVFAEIARLKDETIQPRKQPTQIVPQRKNNTMLKPQVKMIPPPIITSAPPKTLQPLLSRTSRTSSSSSVSNSLNSARTSQLTSLPSLPRSPISHESSYTSPAMSPSFTPSLSPLATRSPTISPLMTPGGAGSVHSSSGQNTPQRARSNRSSGLVTASSESEQELRI